MNNCILVCFLFVFFILNVTKAKAQKKSSKYEVGIAVGAFIYQGDLTPYRFGSLKTMRLGFIVHGSRKINATMAVRLNLSIASLKGDDSKYNTPAYRQQRNFKFSTPLIELSPQLVWSPWGWEELGPKISPYAFAGVGLSYIRIRTDLSNFNASHFILEENLPVRIAADLAHGTPRLLPVIPIGGGIRYAISPKFVMNAELSYRTTFTDYLDGFSKAANPNLKDKYYNVSVGVIYRFGKNSSWDCPPVNK